MGYSDYVRKSIQKDDNGWFYTRRMESSGGKKALKTYICNNATVSKEEALNIAADNKPQPAWDVWIGKKK